LKRLVAGVSGYICDVCVTKCIAVVKQHGGFAPTVPSR
jgi:ATP-dependent protease Clp ATPase subunit